MRWTKRAGVLGPVHLLRSLPVLNRRTTPMKIERSRIVPTYSKRCLLLNALRTALQPEYFRARVRAREKTTSS